MTDRQLLRDVLLLKLYATVLLADRAERARRGLPLLDSLVCRMLVLPQHTTTAAAAAAATTPTASAAAAAPGGKQAGGGRRKGKRKRRSGGDADDDDDDDDDDDEDKEYGSAPGQDDDLVEKRLAEVEERLMERVIAITSVRTTQEQGARDRQGMQIGLADSACRCKTRQPLRSDAAQRSRTDCFSSPPSL